MKKRNSFPIVRNLMLLAVLAVVAPLRVSAQANLQVGMVLDDGRVLVYRGSAAGMTPGDTFEVVRDGQPIGAIRLVEVREMYSIAALLSQSVPVAANDELRIPAGVAKPIEPKAAPESEPKAEQPPPMIEEVEPSITVTERGEAPKDIKKSEAKELEAPAEKKETVEEKEEEPEKKEEKEKRRKRTDVEETKKEPEAPKEKEKKAPASGDVVTDKLLYYDRYRVRAGMVRPRGNHYDSTMAADIDRKTAAIYGLDWITVERPNVAMVMRFLYGEPRIDSGHGDYDGESRYMQASVNFIKSYKSLYFDDNHYFFGFGVTYQRMGANLRCVNAAGCANGAPYRAYSSTREDNPGLNLIWGYRFSAMNVEMDYVVNEGDFILTVDYPLGPKEGYRLVEKKK